MIYGVKRYLFEDIRTEKDIGISKKGEAQVLSQVRIYGNSGGVVGCIGFLFSVLR